MHTNLFNAQYAAQSETQGSLIDEWIQEIHREKYFQLFVPKSLGGLGLSLPEALQVERDLARLDGSLGWTVTLCSGALWFVGFLEDSMRCEVFPDPKVCFAGSGFVGGKADFHQGKYRVNGSWTYASGALHASHFTANCEIWEGGKPLLDEDGKALVKAFLLKRDEVKILDGWNYMGMIATGSHAFEVKDLIVSQNRCFQIDPAHTALPDMVFQYPFLQLAEATLAANILGISLHLNTLIQSSFWRRNEYRSFSKEQITYAEEKFRNSEAVLEVLEEGFDEAVDASWRMLEQIGEISAESLQNVSKCSRALVQGCRESVFGIYPLAGLEAAKMETELNRVWRDFATVSQHALVIFPYLHQ